MDERDHLRIRISLLRDAAAPDEAELGQAEQRLFELEKLIDRYKPVV